MSWTEEEYEEFLKRQNKAKNSKPKTLRTKSAKPYKPNPPTESQEQISLMTWANLQCCTYPELNLLFHIPNGGSRGKAEAGIFMAEGVKAGVPDLFLPTARGGYHGMFIEMKRLKKSVTSDEQLWWLEQLTRQGYYCVICKGWEVAKDELLNYLKLERL